MYNIPIGKGTETLVFTHDLRKEGGDLNNFSLLKRIYSLCGKSGLDLMNLFLITVKPFMWKMPLLTMEIFLHTW